jgi:hypothetical protein
MFAHRAEYARSCNSFGFSWRETRLNTLDAPANGMPALDVDDDDHGDGTEMVIRREY